MQLCEGKWLVGKNRNLLSWDSEVMLIKSGADAGVKETLLSVHLVGVNSNNLS